MRNDYIGVITLNRYVAALVVMTVFRSGDVRGVGVLHRRH